MAYFAVGSGTDKGQNESDQSTWRHHPTNFDKLEKTQGKKQTILHSIRGAPRRPGRQVSKQTKKSLFYNPSHAILDEQAYAILDKKN